MADFINTFTGGMLSDPVQGLYGRDMGVWNPQWARWFDALKSAGVDRLAGGASPEGSNQLRGMPTFARQGTTQISGTGRMSGLPPAQLPSTADPSFQTPIESRFAPIIGGLRKSRVK